MKNIPFFDILFIIITAGVLLLIQNFGNSELLSKCSFIVVIVAYFAGKYVGQYELRKKIKEDES